MNYCQPATHRHAMISSGQIWENQEAAIESIKCISLPQVSDKEAFPLSEDELERRGWG